MVMSTLGEGHESMRIPGPRFETRATAGCMALRRPIASIDPACSPPPTRRDDHHRACLLSAKIMTRLPPRVSPTGFGAGICRSDRPLYLPKGPRSRSLSSRGPCPFGYPVAPPGQPQCASAAGSRPRCVMTCIALFINGSWAFHDMDSIMDPCQVRGAP